MFHFASFCFGDVGVNTSISKLFRKILMSLIELFCDLSTQIGQMQRVVIVHYDKAARSQEFDRMAHAGL